MTGHERLLTDLSELLIRASKYEFHDYKCDEATPKINLVCWLTIISESTKNGKYDDVADEEDKEALRDVLLREGASDAVLELLGLK